MSKLLKLTVFKVFFLILMSFLNLLFNYTRKERLETNKDKIHFIPLLIFVSEVYTNTNNFLSFEATSIKAFC